MDVFIGAIVVSSSLIGWRALARWRRRRAASAALRRSVETLEARERPRYRAHRLMGC